MREGPGIASFIYGLVAAALFAVAAASAQSPLTSKLSPEVREYVKLDDAVVDRCR